MPVNDRISQVYITDGTTKRFDFTFRLFSQDDADGIMVRKKTLLGFDSVDKNLYSVVGNIGDEGGYVMFTTAPVAGQFLYIIGSTAVEQSLSITNYGNFNAHSLERVLDKIIAILQERQGDLTQEQQARLLADVYYDDLAKVREEDLKNYVDGIIGSITGQPFIGIADNFIQVKQPLANSVERTQHSKNADTISIKDIAGVDVTGAMDSTVALQAFIDGLGALGGAIIMTRDAKVRLDNVLYVRPNIAIIGNTPHIGTTKDNTQANYQNIGGFRVAGTASIALQSGSSLTGCLVYRHGMTFPQNSTEGWAGSGISVQGDDVLIERNMVLGFGFAVYSSGYQRPNVLFNKFDCLSGVRIDNCADITRVIGNQCWPFATIAGTGGATANQRSGVAFGFADFNDWPMIISNFSYGYAKGFWAKNINSATFMNCGADSTGTLAGSIGFHIEGSCEDTRIIGCQAAAQSTGYQIDLSIEGQHVSIDSCHAWGNTTNSVLINGGNVSIHGGSQRNKSTKITNAVSRVSIDSVRYASQTGLAIDATVPTSNVTNKGCTFEGFGTGTSPVSANIELPAITSGDPLLLPATGERFMITGNTSFGSISGGYAGRTVTLAFTSGLTVIAGGDAPSGIYLNNGTDFIVGSTSTLTLMHNGNRWFETSRKI